MHWCDEEVLQKQESTEKENLKFDLILVDINKTKMITEYRNPDIVCVKKNMYDKDLKFIAISYRWGELDEELIKTPDYTAHITSFKPFNLKILCGFISREPDLKDIPYLWIDAISVDQYDKERKKETIQHMSIIYKKSTYILAVPDLHRYYVEKKLFNNYFIRVLNKYKKKIYNDILFGSGSVTFHNKLESQHVILKSSLSSSSSSLSVISEFMQTLKHLLSNNNNKKYVIHEGSVVNEEKESKKEIEMVYQFLQYVIEDWSNRTWVISEYHIAKEKERRTGRPMKYIFLSLFDFIDGDHMTYFFSHFFHKPPSIPSLPLYHRHHRHHYSYKHTLKLSDVDEFLMCLQENLSQRTHLDMILNSKASKPEDRFYAILPSWDKYKHCIQDKHTISEFNITDMVSVRLKLYEIMDDLWDKATLLKACSSFADHAILPTFATDYDESSLFIQEIEDPEATHKRFSETLLHYILQRNGHYKNEEEYLKIKKLTFGLYEQNLCYIQLNPLEQAQKKIYTLLVQANVFFICDVTLLIGQILLIRDLFDNINDDDDEKHLQHIFIPFFINAIPNYFNVIPTSTSGIYLLGNMDENKWIVTRPFMYDPSHFTPYSTNYTFNIY